MARLGARRDEVIVHEQRPVPLWQHMLVGKRHVRPVRPTEDGTAAVDAGADAVRQRAHALPRPGCVSPPRRSARAARLAAAAASRRDRPARPRRPAAGDHLHLQPGRLRRRGAQCVHAGLWLTDEDERDEIDAVVEERTRRASPREDLDVLGYWDWRDGLRRGIAAHHAGLIPAFKETVEELFVRGLVRAVFATETLALGINMPARTVVLERLTKFNGETHADLTPGEYTQLTGRAGRRGIDVEGHAVVLWSPEVDPRPRRRARLDPHLSAALVVSSVVQHGGQPRRRRWDATAARGLLESSFAQFQADRGVAGLAQADPAQRGDAARVRAADDLRPAATSRVRAAAPRSCPNARATLSRAGREEPARRPSRSRSRRCARGDVIRVPSGRRAGLAVVLDPGVHPRDDPHPLVVTERRWAGRLSMIDFPVDRRGARHRAGAEERRPPLAAGTPRPRVEPARARHRRAGRGRGARPRSRRGRRRRGAASCAPRCARIRATAAPTASSTCAGPSGTRRLERETDDLRRRIEGRTGSLGRALRPHLPRCSTGAATSPQDETTPAGRQLARIWSESDLVDRRVPARRRVGRARRRPSSPRSSRRWSTSRGATSSRSTGCRPRAVRDALADDGADLGARRRGRGGARPAAEPRAAARASSGRSTAGRAASGSTRCSRRRRATAAELSAGDFVRWCKQVLDLLDQLAGGPAPGGEPEPLAATARAAAAAVRRGVVAQSMQL